MFYVIKLVVLYMYRSAKPVLDTDLYQARLNMESGNKIWITKI